MKRRTLSLLLALVLAASLVSALPVSAEGADDIEITDIALTVPIPKAGDPIDPENTFSPRVTTPEYSYDYSWYQDTGVSWALGTFEKGKLYNVTFRIYPNPGYKISNINNVNSTVNGDSSGIYEAFHNWVYKCEIVRYLVPISDPENPFLTVTVDRGKADKTAAKAGETVTITADPLENYTFDHWEVVSGDVTLKDRTSATTTFVMGDQDVSLRAVRKYTGPMLTDFYVYITPPVAGEHPQAPTVKSEDYTVSAYNWVKTTNDSSVKMTAEDVFEGGSDLFYQCRVDLSIPKYIADDADKLHGYVNDADKTDGMDVMIFRSSFAKVKVVGSFNCAAPEDPTPVDPTPVEPTPETKTNPFKDVSESDWFYEPVLWAYYAEPQVTVGISATRFGPDTTVTRGQTVTFLWRAMGEPEPTITQNPFVDVKESDYFYKAVLWAVENNITVGVNATHFVPGQTCSTAHIITFLYRTLGVGSNGWYEEAGAWAAEHSLLDKTGLTVDPKVNCPRAAVVTFLYRATD